MKHPPWEEWIANDFDKRNVSCWLQERRRRGKAVNAHGQSALATATASSAAAATAAATSIASAATTAAAAAQDMGSHN